MDYLGISEIIRWYGTVSLTFPLKYVIIVLVLLNSMQFTIVLLRMRFSLTKLVNNSSTIKEGLKDEQENSVFYQ